MGSIRALALSPSQSPSPCFPVKISLSSASSYCSLHTVGPSVHLFILSFAMGAPGSPEVGRQPLHGSAYLEEAPILRELPSPTDMD